MPENRDEPRRPVRRRGRDDDRPTIPDTAAEDSDAAWGDGPSARDDDWYRRERPPHHG